MNQVLKHYNADTHITYFEYNTTKTIFKNGVEKIKKTSFSSTKGLSHKPEHNGSYSDRLLEEKTRKYLKRVKTNIVNLAFNYDNWEYFITLTFDFRKVGEYSHEKAIELLTKWINNQKHQNIDMKYLLVPEFHKSGRLHFHGLVADVPKWKFEKSINPNTGKPIKQNGLQIYNLTNYKLGFTTISKIQDQEKVSNYISKYATKELITLKNKKRYWYSRNLEKPKTEYLYLEDNLSDYFKDSDISYNNVFNKEHCSIEIMQTVSSHNTYYVNICFLNLR